MSKEVKIKTVKIKDNLVLHPEDTLPWYIAKGKMHSCLTYLDVIDDSTLDAYRLADGTRRLVHRHHVEDVDIKQDKLFEAETVTPAAESIHRVKLQARIREQALAALKKGKPYAAWYLKEALYLDTDCIFDVIIVDGTMIHSNNKLPMDLAHIYILDDDSSVIWGKLDISKSIPLTAYVEDMLAIDSAKKELTGSTIDHPTITEALEAWAVTHDAVDEHYHAAKFDQSKLRPSLLRSMPLAFTELAKVLTFGAIKYEADSWQEVPNAIQRYTDAADRHDLLQWAGEEIDEESQCLHEAQAIINRLFVLELKLRAKKKELK